MLDILVTILLVTLFVLGLFGLVQWLLGFFPRLKSDQLNPPVGKWWLILLGIVFWLTNLSELLNSGGPSDWTKDGYLKLFYLFAASYLILFVWKSTIRPTQDSTKVDVSAGSGEHQP